MNGITWKKGLNSLDWAPYLQSTVSESAMQTIGSHLAQRQAQGAIVYPSLDKIFAAFQLTPLEGVRVVILGQDPYHGEGQAQGLSFSVPEGFKLPPSLRNIFKELQSDLGISLAQNGCLEPWARQGVFLLNSVLTVEAGDAGAHQGIGWEAFTDTVIALLNQHHQGLVFMLWGSYAQKKGQLINRDRHLVLEAAHPSPLSAYRGFLGCRHFSKANQYLLDQGKKAIDWSLP